MPGDAPRQSSNCPSTANRRCLGTSLGFPLGLTVGFLHDPWMLGQETERLIAVLGLRAHPEGGWYAETFRSPLRVSLPDGRERSASTAIHFLLRAGDFSAFHRVASDEIWHFQGGLPLELVTIDPEGNAKTTVLGPGILDGMETHHAIPSGWWQAARPLGDSGHTLAVCTVAPGFDFADFEMPVRADLLRLFPQHGPLVAAFTRAA